MRTFLFFVFLACCGLLQAQTFTLKSPDVEGQAVHDQLFNAFGCTGSNVSPHLIWENPPEGTKSYALTMYDPDAPTGSGWWQWVVFDIPASAMELVRNAGNVSKGLAPAGAIQIQNDYGTWGYGGPCPPVGDGIHAYIFTIYALDIPSLGLSKSAIPPMVGFNIHAHTIEKASIIMYYERK